MNSLDVHCFCTKSPTKNHKNLKNPKNNHKELSKFLADDILYFTGISRENFIIRLSISCEMSARQTTHMKCLIFSDKKKYVVFYSCN